MTAHTLADTRVLTGRSLRHILRSPDTIITTAVMPIAMLLLFVYVFGGAIDTGPGSGPYVNYLLPGILLITIASGIAYTAFRLFTDMQAGIAAGLYTIGVTYGFRSAAQLVDAGADVLIDRMDELARVLDQNRER